MHILTKNKDTLSHLFTTFSLQEVFTVNQNLSESWDLLIMPPEEIIRVLEANKIAMESFLSTKCLLLSRFYLSESEQQKSVFLSKDELGKLFSGLPAVEAFVFKQQIIRALDKAKKSNQAILDYLQGKAPSPEQPPVLHLTDYPKKNDMLKIQRLNKLSENQNDFLECFYYLQDGELYISDNQTDSVHEVLMYDELSPVQQVAAQKLFQQTEKKLKQNA